MGVLGLLDKYSKFRFSIANVNINLSDFQGFCFGLRDRVPQFYHILSKILQPYFTISVPCISKTEPSRAMWLL